MTHKQKADELVERFYDPIEDFDLKNDYPEDSKRMNCATQCAIICVEEILKENESILEMLIMHGTERTRIPLITRLDELQSVLNELKSRL